MASISCKASPCMNFGIDSEVSLWELLNQLIQQ